MLVVTIANRLDEPRYTSLFIEYAILSYQRGKINVKQENKYLIKRLEYIKIHQDLIEHEYLLHLRNKFPRRQNFIIIYHELLS